MYNEIGPQVLRKRNFFCIIYKIMYYLKYIIVKFENSMIKIVDFTSAEVALFGLQKWQSYRTAKIARDIKV